MTEGSETIKSLGKLKSEVGSITCFHLFFSLDPILILFIIPINGLVSYSSFFIELVIETTFARGHSIFILSYLRNSINYSLDSIFGGFNIVGITN